MKNKWWFLRISEQQVAQDIEYDDENEGSGYSRRNDDASGPV